LNGGIFGVITVGVFMPNIPLSILEGVLILIVLRILERTWLPKRIGCFLGPGSHYYSMFCLLHTLKLSTDLKNLIGFVTLDLVTTSRILTLPSALDCAFDNKRISSTDD